MADAIAGMADQLRQGERVGAAVGRRHRAARCGRRGGDGRLGDGRRAAACAGRRRVPRPDHARARLPHPALGRPRHARDVRELLGRDRGDAGLRPPGPPPGRRPPDRRARAARWSSLAQEWGVAYAQVPAAVATGQPRAALGYLFGAMAGAFGACGLASEGIAAAAAEGAEDVDAPPPAISVSGSPTTIPLIYGAGPIGAVAYRWKTQLNENAKMHAFSHALPELGHNEIVGWEGAGGAVRGGAPVRSRPGRGGAPEHRCDRRLVAAEAALVEVVEARGATAAARGVLAGGPGRLGELRRRAPRAASTRPRCRTSMRSSALEFQRMCAI